MLRVGHLCFELGTFDASMLELEHLSCFELGTPLCFEHLELGTSDASSWAPLMLELGTFDASSC